jgi:hypothetical protein
VALEPVDREAVHGGRVRRLRGGSIPGSDTTPG